jgi:uncharacterized membrane protein
MSQDVPHPLQRGFDFEPIGRMHQGGADALSWVIFALLLLLILLVVAQLAVTLMRPRLGMHKRVWHGPPWGPNPFALAQMRYARGEIDRDTYVQLAQDLGGEPGLGPEAPTPPA